MKLRTKFTLLVTCCTLALLGGYYQLTKYSAEKTFIAFNQQSATILSDTLLDDDEVENAITNQPKSLPPARVVELLHHQFPDNLFLVLDSNNMLHTSAISNIVLEVEHTALNKGYQFTIHSAQIPTMVVHLNRAQLTISTYKGPFHVFWLPKSIFKRRIQQHALKNELLDDFMLNLLFLSFIAAILSWAGAWYFLSPLKRLKQSFKQIEQGHLDTRLKVNRADEVGEIIKSFNNLAAWLQGLHQQYKQMNSDLSHELRTPLNAVRSRIEAMEDGILPLDQKQLSIINQDLTNINRIIDDLCLISLTESNQLSLNMASINLSKLLTELVERFDERAVKQQVKLTCNIEPNLFANADSGRLKQIMINLLDNAFKYGADNGHIDVSLKQLESHAIITVKDNGQGMLPEQTEQIFERFYRVDQARSDKQSLGLGLSICKQLTELMHGSIRVESHVNQGTQFEIKLSLQS